MTNVLLSSSRRRMGLLCAALVTIAALPAAVWPQVPEPVDVEGQPLGANVNRVLEAMQFLGAPMPKETSQALGDAAGKRDAKALQKLLDPHVLAIVSMSPEARVKAARGPAKAILQQGGYTPVLLKVINESTVTKQLNINSPQSGAIFSGGAAGKANVVKGSFLDVEIFRQPPMTKTLSGLKVEYVIALIYSSEAGKREVTLQFDVGQGTQDLGFRGEVPVLFDVLPAVAVKLIVNDYDGKPTVGRFTFKDKAGRVYPSRAKRLAPDFFFQDQIYRESGTAVLLPPGELIMDYGRGPEYRQLRRNVTIPNAKEGKIEVKLERWINSMEYGFYSGDHHIHAAGCAHYTNPTEGVFPQDMFVHVKGEGLNVGCNLTWGPCYDFQRQFFEPRPHKLSEPFTLLRYDVEVSGFGSQSLGHVCLLNLKDCDYPGSDGTKVKGWPTWTTPLMRWAKKQGAYCGYAHSGSGLNINPTFAAQRLLAQLDTNNDGEINAAEARNGLLPANFEVIDANKDGILSQGELIGALKRITENIPSNLLNYAIPELNGIGAQEVFVTTAQGLCDFISAMDTQRVPEWNCWYHIMNCGLPLKVSGETDFPCISGSRVGEGRVYVQLGKVNSVDFEAWCAGLGKGRSYVSDGYAHALEFSVNGKPLGSEINLAKPQNVQVKAKVAFGKDMPLGTAKGGVVAPGGKRLVEIVVNGKAVASKVVPADDQIHDLTFDVPIDRSSWVAVRNYPQLHTNPVNVLVEGKPIRASRKSAQWCIDCIEQLWRARNGVIAEKERDEAQRTFQQAIQQYRKILAEAPEGS